MQTMNPLTRPRWALRQSARPIVAVFTMSLLGAAPTPAFAQGFDHGYGAYSALLERHLRGTRVDYASLKADRAALDGIVSSLAAVEARDEERWSRNERLAFWVNAYNILTLRAVVDHYPIRAGWFSLGPRNSIRQIDGVWTRLRWRVAGRDVTLDDIEHTILRKELAEPLIHFALNCASGSCPPLRAEPYRAAALDGQFADAARRYLGSDTGARVDGTTLRVSSILKWYGEDFVEAFAERGPSGHPPTTRAVLGVLATYGPEAVRELAASGRARVTFLDYDWSLNDVRR